LTTGQKYSPNLFDIGQEKTRRGIN